MADTKTETTAPKADETRKTDAPAPAAAKASDAPAKAQSPSAPAAASAPAPAKAAAPAAAKAATTRAKRSAPARGRKAAPARAAKAPAKAAARAVKAAATPAARAVRTNSASVNKTLNEGTKTMKNEANKVADRVQAVFGDVNERAKTSFERNARFAEELTDLTKGNVEAIVASTKVAAKGVENLGQEVAELSRKSFEEASAALRGFADIKSPTDFFRLQADFARGQFDTFVAESAKMSEAMIKLAGDVVEPMTSRYTVAAERVKNVVAI